MLSRRLFIVVSIGIGITLPLLWLTVYWTLLRGNPTLIASIMATLPVDKVLLVIWPSWIFFVADPEESSVIIPVASIVVNAALYGILGWLVWMGLYRHKAILGAVVIAIISGWYLLLSWYTGAR